jgi:hypothetical protein
MRRVSSSLLVSLILAGSLLLTPRPSRASGEQHPLIRRAAAALQGAVKDLQNAAHDYCGHRVEALGAANNALSQLQQALQCDSGKKGRSAAAPFEMEPEASGAEPHPNIYRAINALGAAERDLQNAAHDYCGHRVQALQSVQNALSQLKLAIQCDKK